jgi:glycine cleavage system H protein
MEFPADLRYSSDHEWARREGDRVVIGITDYAQDALGDVVYVELPTVGAKTVSGSSFSEIESTKSVSDLYAPVDGRIVEVNEALQDAPELVNEDPYGRGWICIIEVEDPSGLDAALAGLLDAGAYRALVEG